MKHLKRVFSPAGAHAVFLKKKTKTLDVSFCLSSWTCHIQLKCKDFIPASMLHKPLNQCDNLQVSGSYEQITSFCSNWTSVSGSLQSCPLLENTHIIPLQQCWDCSEGSIQKLFLCTMWHVTSASHLTHCRIISPSLSWDELCPEDKLQRWISIIVSLLHSCCERGGPALKAGKSSHICLDKWSSSFQTCMPGYLT